MERLPSSEGNVWEEQVRKLIAAKTGGRPLRSEWILTMRNNIEQMAGLLKSIVTRLSHERLKIVHHKRLEVLNHKIFKCITDIVKAIDRLEFPAAKDMIGRSLR